MSSPSLEEIFQLFIGYAIIIIVVGLIPGGFTVWNIVNCIKEKRIGRMISGTLTIFIGGFFYLLLFVALFDTAGEWNVPVYQGQYHYMISSGYSPIIFLPAMCGFVGFFVERCTIFGVSFKVQSMAVLRS